MLYANQDSLLYFPSPPGFPKTPSENPIGYRLPSDWTKDAKFVRGDANKIDAIPFEEAFVKTEDGVDLHTWLMLQPNSDDVPTLIYFHGNAGNMGFCLKVW